MISGLEDVDPVETPRDLRKSARHCNRGGTGRAMDLIGDLALVLIAALSGGILAHRLG